MASTNRKTNNPPQRAYTHEGAITVKDSPINELRRSVLACFLWEDNFYESGVVIATRIAELADKVSLEELSSLAKEARHTMNLRHVPLMLICCMLKRGGQKGCAIISETIADVITRADELTELVSMYWKLNAGRTRASRFTKKGVAKAGTPRTMAPLTKQLLLGLKMAFPKFSEYDLAKYNRDKDVTLKDVLFLANPTPLDKAQGRLWKRLVDDELKTPDTWETAISACKTEAEKKAEWTRLVREGKLGYLALIRNLRNMTELNVDEKLVRDAIRARKGAQRVLPFRYVSAATQAPRYADALDDAFLAHLKEMPKLSGKTVIAVDVSGSMYAAGNISAKSDMSRVHAAGALGAIMREVCEHVAIYATGSTTAPVPAFRGLALAKEIYNMNRVCGGGGIYLVQCMDYIAQREKDVDRVIVFTDEQDCGQGAGQAPANAKILGDTNYIINVAAHQNGIAYQKWTHINGFSEGVVTYVREIEQMLQLAIAG